ncbi:hypothetical protein LTS18_013548, partial [Coniosporium uncinatum]
MSRSHLLRTITWNQNATKLQHFRPCILTTLMTKAVEDGPSPTLQKATSKKTKADESKHP